MPEDVLSLAADEVALLHTGPEMFVEALIQPADNNVRYTVDGQDPTDTLGTLVYAGGSDVIEGSYRIKRCKIRVVGSVAGTVNRRLEWTGNRARKA